MALLLMSIVIRDAFLERVLTAVTSFQLNKKVAYFVVVLVVVVSNST